MMEKYRSEVRRFYETQKALGRLSLNLTYPTVSKLRNECLMLFNEGCDESDLRILKSFMERPIKDKLHESAIRRFDPDKFKALYNFLKRDIKTSEKNVELLAWLIDFHPRPYSNYLSASRKNTDIISGLAVMRKNIIGDQFSTAVSLHRRELIRPEKVLVTSSGKVCENGSFFDQYLYRQSESPFNGNRTNAKVFAHKELFSKNNTNSNPEFLSARQNNSDTPSALNKGHGNGIPTEITLEYPSGVKLSLSTSDIGLISKLIRL